MLIGINGFAGAGKDTLYQRIDTLWAVGATRLAFADKLYESAAAAIGVTVEQLREWKTDTDVVITVHNKRTGEVYTELNVRQYLQWYGTEAHRVPFGDTFWITRVLPEQESRLWAVDPVAIVCVTDARFPNEAEYVRKQGGFIVKVVGPPEVEKSDGHLSEQPLPPELIDFYVDNSVRDDDLFTLDHQAVRLVEEIREKVTNRFMSTL